MSVENFFKTWADKKIFGSFITIRAAAECLAICLVVTGLSFLAYGTISGYLNDTLEKFVERNTRIIAYELAKQFKLELTSLETRAKFVEEGKISPEALVTSLQDMEGENVGIMTIKGEMLAGEEPPEEIVEVTWLVYDGKSIIRYLRGVGLVFAVHMKIDGTPCILFDYYNDDDVRKKFNTISFNGDGTVILLNRLENWTILAEGTSPIRHFSQLEEGWRILGDKIGYDSKTDTVEKDTGAICYTYRGEDYFIYTATVNRNQHFAISGYVPRSSVAVGLPMTYIVLLIGSGLVVVILIMFARITYKNIENRALKQEKFYALQASKTKSDFLSNMSHEIRTPINAILGMDEMILRESKDENISEYAENLRHAGNSLLGIVNDILDFSKIEAGKMEIIPVEYHLGLLLNDLVNVIKPRLEKKNLKLETEVDKKIPGILYGDEIRIKQVVTNILTNAVKYTEHGKVTLTVKFKMIDDENISLYFSVRDTGIGIKEDDLPKLFSAFERIEEERNRTIEGTGLGMNITQQLLKLMGSHLEVSSVYGEGSQFSFKIAQKIINTEPIGDFAEAFRHSLKNQEKYQEKFIAPNAKILVVDDTVMNLTVIKGLLKQTKIQIETAESGYECLKLIEKNRYDIIFLDHRMPGMDGVETLQKMITLPGNKNHKTPIISLTANAISGAREEYISAGFTDYLTKPINSAALESLLIKYLPEKLVQNPSEENFVDDQENLNLPDWLKKVDGLNVKEGIEHCGDSEIYLDALTVFAEAVESGANEIQRYFDAADWKNYTTKVHALKSSAKVVGADELSDKAKRLEYAGNSNYIDEIEKFTAPLLELYRSYSEKLSPLIKKDSHNLKKNPIEPDELAEAYETLREVTKNFDYDSLEFVLQSLEEYELPTGDAEKFSKLKAAAEKLDWEEIKLLLDK